MLFQMRMFLYSVRVQTYFSLQSGKGGLPFINAPLPWQGWELCLCPLLPIDRGSHPLASPSSPPG